MTASIRDKLRSKQRRSTVYPLAVADTSEAEHAAQQARMAYHRAVVQHETDDHPEVAAAQQRLNEAERAEAECYEYVTVRALPADDFEALADAHSPQNGDGESASWHEETFRPALLAACVESDMTEDDWASFFKEAGSYGDQSGIFTVALQVNTRTPSPSVPKDSSGMSS